MQYVIDDEYEFDLDISLKPLPIAEVEVVLPVITLSNEETPVVTPLQILDYGSSSIEVSFTTTTERAEEVVKGVLCGTENPPTFENADYRLLHGQGSLDLAFAGLHHSTEYYLRPYALSNLGYTYGAVVAQRTKTNPIPDTYQLVEFIESTGTQFIDTNELIDDKNTSLEIEYDINITGRNTVQYTGGNFYAIMSALANNTYGIISSSGVLIGNRDIVKTVSSGGVTRLFVNGTQEISYNESGTRYNIKIGIFRLGQDNNSWWSGNLMSAELYHYKLTKNDTIVRDMYPVYRKNDNKPGLYDIVNNTFYINAGTGEFIVGPDKEWDE